ncbi:antitoxin [Candidatus Aerophobetes bacterium Ae_b3b]|nr:MAG: antitoxin [Candidatus Aerophobetes bacterium Ae_b3b]
MEKERIVVDNKVHFGQPCIAGTRIPVYCVLELVQAGISFQEIIDKYYPDLTIEDVQACVKYATEIVKSEEVHIAE